MKKKIEILIIIAVFVIGLIKNIYLCIKYHQKINFINEFYKRFGIFLNKYYKTYRVDGNEYVWIVKNIEKVQLELGDRGIINEYIDKLYGYKIIDYKIFMNILDKLRQNSELLSIGNSIIYDRLQQELGICEDCLLRHLGYLEKKLESSIFNIFNPFSWFFSGIKFVFSLPLLLLSSIGIEGIYEKCLNNKIYNIIGNIISVIGLVSSIITIFTNWQLFIDILRKIMY